MVYSVSFHKLETSQYSAVLVFTSDIPGTPKDILFN